MQPALFCFTLDFSALAKQRGDSNSMAAAEGSREELEERDSEKSRSDDMYEDESPAVLVSRRKVVRARPGQF
ncbi:hypothetical protein EV368DRAFT_89610 [Lentinula lateritia]|nr:hypothetical protein EV368DRAFT_89610 [Lentinula lateritia]